MRNIFKVLLAFLNGIIFFIIGSIIFFICSDYFKAGTLLNIYEIVGLILLAIITSLAMTLVIWLFEKKSFLKIWVWSLVGCLLVLLISYFYAAYMFIPLGGIVGVILRMIIIKE